MYMKIVKSGNSASVRLPSYIMKSHNLKIGQSIPYKLSGDTLELDLSPPNPIYRKSQESKDRLKYLMSKTTDPSDNHPELL